ncbi:hypothetical protein DUI87_12171 [Hirundo rustica rustica]|uniref:ribonuclease H n=1 Tax=Hirundo rustica rustica TaxID=333673 RepID=A0A3M0KCU5_HIRRU|nr:hypothetical protein DUI87_12171 [Hirundo rustica rustica]
MRRGLTELIEQPASDSGGLLKECLSEFNTPILPVRKHDESYWIVQDLRAVNKVTEDLYPVVANPYTLLTCQTPELTWFTVLDLKDAFFCLPIHEDSQKIFAFEWENPKSGRKSQLTWSVLPQGFKNSPTLFGEQLAKDLESWEAPPEEGKLLQYVDDILIATRTKEACVAWTVSLLNFLGLQGYRVSKKKAQVVKQKVIYLGYEISAGQRTLGQDRKEAISQTPRPQVVKELRTFFGMTGWCRLWIHSYGLLVKPLYALITNGNRNLQWTKEATQAFHQLKNALMSAPALGLPNVSKPFFLFSHEKQGIALGILAQDLGPYRRAVAYFSKQLDTTAKGWPGCLRAVAAVVLNIQEACKFTLGQKMTIFVSHTVPAVLEVKGGHWLSPQRFLNYQAIMVEQDDVEIVVTNIINPASFLSGSQGEPVHHDCLETIEASYSSCPDLKDTPLDDPETWFTDGSSYVISGKRRAGYAVTTCRKEILRLLEAVQLPEQVAIMHIKAHQKVSSELEEGNELADREAKEAAKGEITIEGALIPDGQVSLEAISATQELESISNQKNAEWPWSQAFIQYTGSMGNHSDIKDLNLSTMVMHENQIYERREWQKQKLWTLQGTIGEVVRVGCRMINGTNYEKAIQISVSTSPTDYHREICDRLSKSDCWYNFTLVQMMNVICLWGCGNKGLSFKFKITTTPIATTKSTVTQAQTTPPKIEHKIYEIGPYVIRNTGQQQLLFNPEWSLKCIEVLMQTNISEIQPACSSFLRTSFEGWTTWLQKQVHFRGRMRRDLTGILGTGLGVLNGIDSEILMNKLATATNDLVKLRQPLQSSLLALGTSQWEISTILPKWKEAEDQDHKLIISALNIAQNNVLLALSCIQAQLWIQSIVALVVREGNEGTFPIEIRKIVWDNASNLERKLQSWWTLVNFTYDPTTEIATTFVLTIRNATIYNIHPIIALGLNHENTVLYPSEHRAWARIMNEKWQTVNLESCVTQEQQGFICDTNIVDAQDICLDTEQNICHFEIHPDTSQKTMLVYILA